MTGSDTAIVGLRRNTYQTLFGAVLLGRLLYPFFNSPLTHLYSDPLRHWENGANFLHPTIMGSSDPYCYQLWLFVLRTLAQDASPSIALGCGILCAAMPYGWYRALRELQTRERALIGATLIGLIPESIGLYGYFMNETLLVSLLGFCFWMTLRSHRKATLASFGAAVALWLCAAFTRTVALPMACGCLALLWISQPQKSGKAALATLLAAALAIPAGLHGQARLGFFAPLGNLYFNEIYSVSGMKEIAVDYGADGRYRFGSPSFYTPTFVPFSDWTTNRTGIVSISVDLATGRPAWVAAKARVASVSAFPRWRQRVEDGAYTLFGPTWPNTDRATVVGWLTLWARWMVAPVSGFVLWAFVRRRYAGPAFIVPACALGTLLLLLLQSEAIMEGRYREPIDAILAASALLAARQPPRGDTLGA